MEDHDKFSAGTVSEVLVKIGEFTVFTEKR